MDGKKELLMNKPIDNPTLVKAMIELKENPSRQNENTFFVELLNARFLAPAIISEIDGTEGEITLEKDTKIQLIHVIDPDRSAYLPAFTDWDELRKWEQHGDVQTLIFTLNDYEQLLKSNENYKGFVINMLGENIMLNEEHMKMVHQNEVKVEKKEKIMIGVPMDYPAKMVDALVYFLPSINSVATAYLLLMMRDKEQSYLLIIDTKEDKNKVFPRIAEVAVPFLKADEKVDFVLLNSDLGRDATKDQLPFYIKKQSN